MAKEMIDSKEFEAAEKAAEESTGITTITLSKPFTYEGKTYEKFDLDFTALTGRDFTAIEVECAAVQKVIIAPSLSTQFLYRMAAKAAHVGSDIIIALPIADFNRVRSAARSFLMKTE